MIKSANSSKQVLVIVGNGMVSHGLCSRLAKVKANEKYDIIVFGDEPRPAYDRVRLTSYFEGSTEKDLELADELWYRNHEITLNLSERIKTINRAKQTVVSETGRELAYDKLVLITGSKPFVPPIEGINHPGVFVYRTIEDLEAIKEYSQSTKSAAVLGGGLLGLEAAKALYDLELQTHIKCFALLS